MSEFFSFYFFRAFPTFIIHVKIPKPTLIDFNTASTPTLPLDSSSAVHAHSDSIMIIISIKVINLFIVLS